MTDFRFANPEFLMILLSLPLAMLLLGRIDKGARNRLVRFMAEANLQQLLLTKGTLKDKGKKASFWIGMILLIVAFARPQANPTVEEVQSSGLDIYVLLDVSRSMDVEDVAPSRLKKAKKTIQHLTARLAGDRVGVIAYANSAVLLTPLTSDYSIIDSYLKNIDTSVIPSQGTNLGGALEVAALAMERGAKSSGTAEDRSNIFIVMSDGEDYGDSDLSIVDSIRKSNGIVFSIAFGTERGAPIPLRDEKGELRGYKTDLAKNPVVSGMKPGVLQESASRGGGHFYYSTLEESEVEDLLARVSDAQRGSFAVIKTTVYEEWYGYFLAPALLFFVFSFVPFLALTGLKSSRLRIGSWLKKKVSPVTGLLIVAAAAAFSSSAFAHPLDFLWTKEKKASYESAKLAKEKKFTEAVDTLKGLQAENPDNVELNYNIGTYMILEQKHSQGREQLSRLRSADDKVREPALFNSGGSFALEGKKEGARAAYAELLQLLSKKTKLTEDEAKLLAQTRRNVERLADPAQQPQAQQDKSQQQEQKQENKGGSGGEGDQKKDSKGGSGENKQDQDKGDQDKKSEGKEKGDDGKSKDEKDKDKDKGDSDEKGKTPEGQGDKDKQKKDGEGDSDKKQEPDDKNEDGKGGQGKENGKLPPRKGGAPFKERDNMGEDDAKRILGALKERESGLQKKFLKDQVKGGKVKVDDAAKDW